MGPEIDAMAAVASAHEAISSCDVCSGVAGGPIPEEIRSGARAAQTSALRGALRCEMVKLSRKDLKRLEKTYCKYLKSSKLQDPIIQFHLSDLNETLLEQNILRLS